MSDTQELPEPTQDSGFVDHRAELEAQRAAEAARMMGVSQSAVKAKDDPADPYRQ